MSGYKRVNFYELCRLCATNQQKDKTHIFQEEGRKIQLQNKIQNCLSLTVCENDFLPKVVCSKCLRSLEVCSTFRQECVTSESMLSSYFKNFRYTEDFKKSGKVYIKDTTVHSKSPNSSQFQQLVETSSANAQQVDHVPFYTVQLPILTNPMDANNAPSGVSNNNSNKQKSGDKVVGYNLNSINLASAVKNTVISKEASVPTSTLSNVVVNANGEVLNIAQLVDFESLMTHANNLQQAPTQKSKILVKQPPKKLFKEYVGSTGGGGAMDETSPVNNAPVIKIDLTRNVNDSNQNFERKPPKFASYTIKMEDHKVIFNNQEFVGAPPVVPPPPAAAIAPSVTTTSGAPAHNFNSFAGGNFHQTTGETSTVNLNVLSQELVGSFRNNNSVNNNNISSINVKDEAGGAISGKSHICEICQKSFKRREHLYQHVKLHTGFRPYTCENCNKSFMRKEHLLRHMTSHSGQKNFTCNICDKSFSRNDNLLKHKKTHDKQTSYTCEICQKQFVMKHYYLAHKMTHESDRCTAAIAAANVWNVLKT